MNSFARNLSTLVVLFIIFSFLNSCTKLDARGDVKHPGVALTFDDSYISEWHKLIPLLDSFHAKATFYISNYDAISREDKKKLKELQAHGHEIAFHTTNHFNLNDYVKNCPMDQLIKKEILYGLKRMNADGFYPKTFAYPYGQHNDLLDNTLLQHFKSVRALNGTNNYSKSFATTERNKILYGLGIDESSKRPFNTILQLLHNAASDKTCLVLVAHHVDRNDMAIQLPIHKLRKIIQESAAIGLKFYTVSEISEQ